jgi:dihydropteroate synthase
MIRSMFWQTTRFRIDLAEPQVMGIVNVTPDSFSADGSSSSIAAAIATCDRLLRDGAQLLDIGGESSRPGAEPVGLQVELDRVMPVLLHALRLGVPVSLDTTKPDVMREALDAGADIVNDIHALQAPGAVDVVAAHRSCGVCLMHMRGEPASMQSAPAYGDVVAEVIAFLDARRNAARAAGIADERIVLDPGIGFGKTAGHNLELLRRQRELLTLARPLLVGWSRKSTLGSITGRAVGERGAASVAAALMAVERGARIVRVHDVAATVDALKVWQSAQPLDR